MDRHESTGRTRLADGAYAVLFLVLAALIGWASSFGFARGELGLDNLPVTALLVLGLGEMVLLGLFFLIAAVRGRYPRHLGGVAMAYFLVLIIGLGLGFLIVPEQLSDPTSTSWRTPRSVAEARVRGALILGSLTILYGAAWVGSRARRRTTARARSPKRTRSRT